MGELLDDGQFMKIDYTVAGNAFGSMEKVYERALRHARQHPRLVKIRIGTKRTTGKKWRGGKLNGKWVDASRDAGENAIAINTNAKYYKRNFCWLDSAEITLAGEAWKNAYKNTLLNGKWSWQITEKLALQLGMKFIKWFKAKLAQGRGPRGAFRPNTPIQQRVKKAETRKAVAPPPMHRTEQLKDALVVHVKRS